VDRAGQFLAILQGKHEQQTDDEASILPACVWSPGISHSMSSEHNTVSHCDSNRPYHSSAQQC
jgi:hypothetical protein